MPQFTVDANEVPLTPLAFYNATFRGLKKLPAPIA